MQIIRTRALAKALVQPISKRTIQGFTKKIFLSNDGVAQSKFTRTAMDWLAASTKATPPNIDNGRPDVATDLHKLQSIAIEAGGAEVV